MKPSLKHIAEHLGLSKTTVSWVLSGKGDEKAISRSTQDRIMQYAKDVNYLPNLLARSLNTGQSGTLGLIVPSIADSFYSQMAKIIESEAEKQGYSLMICSSESNQKREDRMIGLFKAKQVDGIILAPAQQSEAEVRRLVDAKYPLVLFDRLYPGIAADTVVIDNSEATYVLTKRLLEEGARKIVLVTTNPHLTIMELRKSGFHQALAEGGIGVDGALCVEVGIEDYERSTVDGLRMVLEQHPQVDGLVFTTHILAIEAIRFFHHVGIPLERFRLGCVHSVPTLQLLAPHMNVAYMPIEEMGAAVVNAIVGAMDLRNRERAAREPMVFGCRLEYGR